MLNKLNELNPHIKIDSLEGAEFKKYGKVHTNAKIDKMLAYLLNTEMSNDYYLPICDDLLALDEAEYFKELCYGQVPCQIGYYNAFNSSLNALEYHKCSETLIVGTDIVLLLATIFDLDEDYNLNSEYVKAFFVPKGTIVELYSSTLHFSPCMATTDGVRQVVVLSKNTNTPLDHDIVRNSDDESKLLLEKNKWVIVHPECKSLVARGAFVGIHGENIKINHI